MNKLLRYTLQIALLAGLVAAQPVWAQQKGKPKNNPPVAEDDAATVVQGNTVVIPVLENDTDPDSDPLTVQNVRRAKGVVRIQDDGTLLYRPTPNFVGEDDFEYTITDGKKGKASAQVRVRVRAAQANLDPVPEDDTATTDEDTPVVVAVLDNDNDPDEDALSVDSVTPGTSGSAAINPDGTVTYTPDENFYGSDSFTYTVSDNKGGSATATVTIAVNPVNDAPVITSPATAGATEDELFTYTATASDVDDATVTITFSNLPGWLTTDGSTVSGTPTEGVTSGSFTITASDGELTALLDVTVTIGQVNDPPVADDKSVTTDEDTAVDIVLSGTDPEGTTLSYNITADPTSGSLSGEAPNLTYTPEENYNGDDAFTYTVDDGINTSAEATVIITIEPVNDAPVVADIPDQTISEGGAFTAISLDDYVTDSDNADSEITWSYSGAADLTVTINNNHVAAIGIPDADWNGSETITFTATDPGGLSDSDPATFTVTAINDAPVAVADTFSFPEDSPVRTLDVLANDIDVDGDDLVITNFIQANGILHIINGGKHLSYEPTPNFSGEDVFYYTIRDAAGVEDEGKVTVTVGGVNDAPVADAQSVSTNEDTPLEIILTGSDPDEDALTYSVTSGPSHGALSGTAPDLTYTPASHYSGSDGFTFRVTDPGGLYDEADVTIAVAEVNLAPVADAQSVSTNEDTPVEITLTGSDPDEDALTYTVTSDPSQGALSGTAPDLTYTPGSHYSGSDGFTFRVTDPGGLYDEADVTITVAEVNLAPVADAQSVSTEEDTPKAITLTGSDPDGDELTFTVTSEPANGSLTGTAPDLTYTPSSHYSGSDGFTFRATDPGGLYGEADVTIEVTEVNLAPVADAQSVSTDEDTPLEITLTGSDPDEDALTYTVTSGPSHGALSGTAPDLTYTPGSHYSGSDDFTFRATDPGGLYDEATVTVLVNLAGDLAADEPVDPNEGGTITTDIGVYIEILPQNSPGETVNIQIGTYEVLPPNAPSLAGMLYFFGPSGTTFDPPATITVPYDPLRLPDGFDPADLVLLIYSESDGTWAEALNSVVDTDAQTVSGQTYHFSGFAAGLLLARAPYSLGLPGLSINEDAQATTIIQDLTDYFADPNFGDQIDFDATNLDTGLHLVLVANDSLIVEPRPNFNGDVRIVITATDSTGLWVSDTLFLTVTPDNDSPFFLTAVADAYTISEDQLLRIHLSADDVEGDDVTFGAASDTSAVTTLVQDTTLLVAPVQNWYGTAHIVVSASDGQNTTYLDPFTLTIEAVNDPPSAFELLAPDIDALLQVETSQLGDSLTFTWKEVIDPDDPVNYTFTLSDTGAIYFEYDTTTTATEVRVPYADIVSAITNQGLKTAAFEWTVVAIAGQDIIEASNGPNSLTVDINTLAVMDESHLPQFFALHQNYPNPFNPVTTLRYELPAYCQVLLVIYDMRGREVVRLVDGYISAGYNRVIWNSGDAFGRPVPSGIYFARLITPEYSRVIKMSLIR